MTATEVKLDTLCTALVEVLGAPVSVTITNNRRTVLSYRWCEDGLTLRLHRMFLQSDYETIRAVASFCRRPGKRNRAALDEFIRLNRRRLNGTAAPLKPIVIDTEGRYHDLADIFRQINRKYFKRQCNALITWGKETRSGPRRGMQLGSYDQEANLIRIHRALDARWVPQYVLETLIYHEMLHWLFRPRQRGDRRVLHGKAFVAAERAHPSFERSSQWVKKNLDRLLNS